MFQEEAFKVAEGKYLLDAGNEFLKLFESVVASLVSAQNVEIILNLEFA